MQRTQSRDGASAARCPRQLLWCALAATGSVLLLAVTNHITQNIAAVPLLWIVPLSLYLMTFILCFDGRGWYRREIFLAVLAAALGVMAWTLADPQLTHELALQLGVFCVGLFIACMFCHGELVRLKPAPRYLTRFYLMISLGGALGSSLVGIVAPLVLHGLFRPRRRRSSRARCCCCGRSGGKRSCFPRWPSSALLVTIGCGIWSVVEFYEDTMFTSRNFYGVLRVQEPAPNDLRPTAAR